MITVAQKSIVRTVLSGAFLLGWALVAHQASASEGGSDFGLASAAAALLTIVVLLSWRASNRLLAGAGVLALMALLVCNWQTLRSNVALLYYLQHVGINTALALLFGRSLLGPGEPLVTRLARVAHAGKVSNAQFRYTRLVTVAWTLFFASTVALSTALFFFASPNAWSIFANLLAVPLLFLMFLGEYLVRHRVLPPSDRTGIAETIRAYRQSVRERDSLADRR